MPDLVFDHHPMRKATSAAPGSPTSARVYGATATILAEYLEAAGLPPSRVRWRPGWSTPSAPKPRTSAARRRARTTPPTTALLPHIDRRTLARIQTARLPFSYFSNLRQRARGAARGRQPGGVEPRPGRPARHRAGDRRPPAADGGQDLVAVDRHHGDRLYLSIRTTNPRADAGNLMRRLIGRRGKGGGHGTMAGGYVVLPENLADGGRGARAPARGELRAGAREEPRAAWCRSVRAVSRRSGASSIEGTAGAAP